MRLFSILFFSIILSANGFGQCRNTFVYGCRLPPGINPQAFVLRVYYKGKPLQAKTRTICSKKQQISPTFSFLPAASCKLNNNVLPYTLPGGNFYWMMDDDMGVELATDPNNFKIVVDTKSAALKMKYELPATYDFVSQNAIYLDLIDRNPQTLNKMYLDHIWMLSISLRQTQIEPKEKDTTLVYSARDGFPAGIVKRFPELENVKTTLHSTLFYSTKGMLRKGKLYLKMPEGITKPVSDGCTGKYVSLEGAVCFTKGGISGAGCGECGLLPHEKVVAYQVDIQIEP